MSDDQQAGKGKKRLRPREVLEILQDFLAAIPDGPLANVVLSGGGKSDLRESIAGAVRRLADLSAALDPVKQPPYVLDPSNPEVMGRLIADTLLVQPRQAPLNGVNALYGFRACDLSYRGHLGSHRLILTTETPICLRKAVPADQRAVSAVDQGQH